MSWEKREMGDLIDLYDNIRIPLSAIEREKKQGEYPYYGAQSIIDYVNEYIFDGDYILIAEDGENLRTRTQPIAFAVSGQFWVNNHAHIVKGKDNIADDLFIKYYLNNLDINPYVTGAAQPKLSQRNLKAIIVDTPPLSTQRKIASILSAYDDLIENNLKRIRLLEEQAFLRYKGMQQELEKRSNKINLYDFADIQMGFAFKAEAFNELGEGIPIIRIRDIPNQITKSYTTQEVESSYFVEKGDLLIGMDGEFHMNEWLGQRGYLVQRVCRLRSKDVLHQSYLWQALKEPIHYYETTISGATVAHLGKKHLEEIFIEMPKKSMNAIMEELNAMRKLKINLAEQNAKLREARDILLPKLMNGQIEV